MFDYCDYMSQISPTDINPCTPINSAYPRYENIDFTAPELSFDGTLVRSIGLRFASVETISKERFESFKPCDPGSYPDSLLRPCDIE